METDEWGRPSNNGLRIEIRLCMKSSHDVVEIMTRCYFHLCLSVLCIVRSEIFLVQHGQAPYSQNSAYASGGVSCCTISRTEKISRMGLFMSVYNIVQAENTSGKFALE
jgi:hypothetical protein